MAAFAALSLADGQGTPVNHTFNPLLHRTLPDGRGLFEWMDNSVNSGVLAGANRVRMFTRFPNMAQSKSAEMRLALEGQLIVPVMDTLDATVRAEETTVWFKIVRGGRASVQHIKDVNAYTRSLLANAVVQDIVNDFKEPY